MKILTPLVLFAAASASAEKILQHGWCKQILGRQSLTLPVMVTNTACKSAGGASGNYICTLKSAKQIKKFYAGCKKGGTELCFSKKGNELPKGVPIPACTFTKTCELGAGKCGCVQAPDFQPSSKCKKGDNSGDNSDDKKGDNSGDKNGDENGDKAGDKANSFPGVPYFYPPPNNPIITRMGKRLVEKHCNEYEEGPGPQWTEADRKSYQCWQEKMGYTGKDADGWPGKDSWDELFRKT